MPGLPDIASPEDLGSLRSKDDNAIVRQVGAAVRRYCRWHVAPVIEQTITTTGTDDKVLFLQTMRIVELIEVRNDGAVLDLADVDFDPSDGYLELRRGVWTRRPGRIVVKLRHGFDLPTDDGDDVEGGAHDIVGVISQVALRAIDSPAGRVREHAGQVDIGFGLTGTGVSGGIALLEHEKALLDPYRVTVQ